jgi:hypothetical protein
VRTDAYHVVPNQWATNAFIQRDRHPNEGLKDRVKLVHSDCWRWFENQSCSAHDVLISSELLAELDLDRMTSLLNMTQRLGLGGIAVAFLDLDYPAAAPLGRP